MEYWLAAKIYNVNDNIEVKVVVLFKGKLKSARGLLVYLVLIAVLYKMLNIRARRDFREDSKE